MSEPTYKIVTLENVDLANDFKDKINYIQSIVSKIPADGHYDESVVSNRVGQYIQAMLKCGELLAQLKSLCAFREIEYKREEADAALTRAPLLGYKTSSDKKMYTQMDEEVIKKANSLEEVRALIIYIENYKNSLDKAHLHCKKILDSVIKERNIANGVETFPAESEKWI